MTPEKVFGKILKKIRHEHSLSQEALGFESGYHRTYISLLERGRMTITVRVNQSPLIRHAEALIT